MMDTIAAEVVDTGEKRDRRGRRIALEHERAKWIEQYERSGLTQRAFAEREGIRFFTFTGWLKRHRQRKGKTRFAEVAVRRPPPLTMAVEIALPNGVVVRGGDIEQIVTLVERLRRC
jgi:transposase-like protein